MISRLVTIGIPFFNNENSLSQAIESVLKQTHKEIELILINDGSTDGSKEIAKLYVAKDVRVRFIDNEINSGTPKLYNLISDIAQGFYIARMDADDLMDLRRIEQQVSFLEKNSDIDVVTSGVVSLDSLYQPQGKRCNSSTQPNLNQLFKNGEGLIHASMMARASWFKKNRYSEEYIRAEDRELFIRTFKTSRYHILPTPLYYYVDAANMSLPKYLQSYKSERKVLWNYWKESLSLWTMFILLIRSYLKSFVIRFYFLFGIQKKLVLKKNAPLDPLELEYVTKQIHQII